MLDFFQHMGIGDHRFRRNTTHIETSSAKIPFFDQRDFCSILGCFDGSDIPTSPCANDNQIKILFFGHTYPFSRILAKNAVKKVVRLKKEVIAEIAWPEKTDDFLADLQPAYRRIVLTRQPHRGVDEEVK